MDRIWTDEDRKRQAEVIKKNQIWLKSTGPKTQEGKDKSKMNALKHGVRSEYITLKFRYFDFTSKEY